MNAVLKPISNRIEILFWDLFINSLSKSRLVRSVIPAANRFIHENEIEQNYKTYCLIAAAGLACGILLSILRF
jgi:hypothetical protein